MPVQAFFDDRYLVEKKLVNYWGYNTVNYFSLAPRYISRGADLHEFKVMVRRLHEAGLEVILDVVYNHTAEGNHLGPTLSFRGIDNASYYMLAQDKRHYFDATGCGNTVNLRHPRVLQMVTDSLRYWVEECHVDGFRFDLATSLGREYDQFDTNAVFFDAVRQDPVLVPRQDDRRALGRRPERLSGREFSARLGGVERPLPRRDAHATGRATPRLLPTVARDLLASSDLFEHQGRKPWASVNFVTAHDGFTLADLYAYNTQAQRGERRGQPRRPRRQPQLELRRRGADRRPGDPRPARPHAPQHHGDAAPFAGHADAPDGRRGRPHAERQQQRLLPGQRDRLARLEGHLGPRPRLHGVRARRHPHPAALSAPALRKIPARPGDRRQRHPQRRLVPARRAGDGRRLVVATRTPRWSACCSATRRRGCSSSPTPTTSRSPSSCRPRRSPRSGSCASIPRPAQIDPPDRSFDPGQAVELPGRAAFFLAGTPA